MGINGSSSASLIESQPQYRSRSRRSTMLRSPGVSTRLRLSSAQAMMVSVAATRMLVRSALGTRPGRWYDPRTVPPLVGARVRPAAKEEAPDESELDAAMALEAGSRSAPAPAPIPALGSEVPEGPEVGSPNCSHR